MDRNFASIQYFLGNETYLLSIPKPQFKREVQYHSVLELLNIHTRSPAFLLAGQTLDCEGLCDPGQLFERLQQALQPDSYDGNPPEKQR